LFSYLTALFGAGFSSYQRPARSRPKGRSGQCTLNLAAKAAAELPEQLHQRVTIKIAHGETS
jgi:hypothetical protein